MEMNGTTRPSFWVRLKCVFLGHEWSMYRGYGDIYPHSTAHCLRCGEIPPNN